MNMVELKRKEISNVTGGFNVVDLLNSMGGVVGCLVAAGYLGGKPTVNTASATTKMGGMVMLGRAYLALPYLTKAGIILGCYLGGNIIGYLVGKELGNLVGGG